MNRLKISTLSIFAFFAANSLNAAGVAYYDATEDGSYEAALDELSTPTSTTTTTYEDGYTLTQVTIENPASDTDVVITKYVSNEDGTLTAVQFIVTKDDGYDVERQTTGTDISMNFVGLTGSTSGLALSNSDTSESVKITGDFIGNSLICNGGTNGVLTNSETISSITGDFIYNYSRCTKTGNAANSGVIFNTGSSAVINLITGDFIGNYAQLTSGSSGAKGGVIWNNGGTITAIEGSFISNFAQSNANGTASGGAVLNTSGSTIGFLAQNTDTEFTGNFTLDGTVYASNAIANTGTVNFNAYNDYTITVNDAISNANATAGIVSTTKGTININGEVYAADDTSKSTNLYANAGAASKVIFNNNVTGQDIFVHAGTLELGSYAGGLEFSITTTSSVSYTTKASIANLVNSTITVNNDAILQIAASGVSFDSSSSLTLKDGATLILDAASSLTFTSTSSLILSVEEGDFSITFNIGAGSSLIFGTTTYDDIYAFLNNEDNLATLFGEDDTTNITLATSDDSSLISTLLDDEGAYLLTLSGTLDTEGLYTLSITATSTAVPEPSTYAMILGALALGFAYYRRRK